MNFKSVEVENFKSFGQVPVKVNLAFKGKKLLVGKNGIGKTSLFDAIVWCIYGKTDLRADNVVNKIIKKDCKVEVCFENNQHEYVITRYRKHHEHGNNAYLFEDGVNITLKGALENQEKIIEIINIDYKALCSSVILSSETYNQFLREKNAARLAIFESLFSLKEINDYSTITRKKIKEIQADNVKISNETSSLNGSVESMLDTLKNYNNSFKEKTKKAEQKVIEVDAEIKEKKGNIASLEKLDVVAERTNLTNLQEIARTKGYLEEQISALVRPEIKDITDLEKIIESTEDRIQNNKLIDVQKEIALIDKTEKTKELINKLQVFLTKEENAYKSLEKEYNSILKSMEVEKSKLFVEEQKLKDSESNRDVCPYCGSVIGGDKFEELLSIQKNEINIIKFNLTDFSAKEFTTLEKMETHKASIDKITKAIPELPKLKYTRTFLMDVSSSLAKDEAKLYTMNDKKVRLESQLMEYNTKFTELNKQLELLPKIEIRFTIEQLDKVSKTINDLNSDIKVLESQKKHYEEESKSGIDKVYVAGIAKSVREKKSLIEGLEKQTTDNELNIVYLQSLYEVFSNGEGGFKKYFIENSIDMFNDKINMYLPFFFTDDMVVTFDKNLQETIIFKGMEAEFNELSSGQKTRCELAVIFSLYMMVRALFGSGTNLLVFDEILDRNLDDDGVNSVINVINNVSKDSAVFIVSHKEEYKDKIPEIIKVELDGNGFTKIIA